MAMPQMEKKKKVKKKNEAQKQGSDSDSDVARITSAVDEMMIVIDAENKGNEGCSCSTVEQKIAVASDDAAINHVNGVEMIWIPDSGATIHATSHREYFTNYTAGDFGVVKMGNNDRAAIIGKGDVHLETANGTKLFIKFVRHVEALRLNIFSVGLLDANGYSSRFEDG